MPGTRKKDYFVWDVPCHIVKGDGEKPWLIEGLASTPDRDAQGEVVDQNGLDITPLQAKKGYFNEDHKPGIEHKVGKITHANKTGKGLFVKGYLFKNSPKAKAFHDIMTSLQKGDEDSIRMSIEGKVLKRGSNNIIQQAKITGVALTLNPVNENTYARFVKALGDNGVSAKEDFGVLEIGDKEQELESALTDFQAADYSTDYSSAVDSLSLNEIDQKYTLVEKTKLVKAIKLGMQMLKSQKETKEENSEEDTAKAIATGNYNVAPAQRTQSAAMAKESLDKKEKLKKRLRKSEKERRNFTALFHRLNKSYPNVDAEKVLELACLIYEDKKDQLFKNDDED